MKIALVLPVMAVILAACTSSPTLQQTSEFGKSAASAANTYVTAQATEVDLIKTASVEAGACEYISGGKLAFPARRIAEPSADIKEQILFLKAIEDYATALSEAVDPAGVAKLEAAANGFVASAKDIAEKGAALQGGTVSPAIGPAIKLTTTIGITLFEQGLRRRIRRVVAHTDNVLLAGSIKLEHDIDASKKTLNDRYLEWLKNRRCTLDEIRSRPMTGDKLYSEYVEANRIAGEFQARIKVLDRAGAILGQLVDTHGALLDDDVDLNASPAKFRALAAEVNLIRTGLAQT